MPCNFLSILFAVIVTENPIDNKFGDEIDLIDWIIGGIFWVWLPILGINEIPSSNTIVGGFLIFMSIVYYSMIIQDNKRFIGLN